ncbi:MAG: Periplasmic AppA protein [Luteibacter sp.]|nr:MAG: Periplasmic AppA protein [Luteibacter sp.]
MTPHARPWLRHLVALLGIAVALPAYAGEDLRLDQVILIYRHGVRSPLPGEIQVDEVHGKPWPTWSVAPSILTQHGREGVMAMGRYDRAWMSDAGLFPKDDCPANGSVAVWANTDQRTIASGQAYADAFAPGCTLAVGHLPEGATDPLFNPVAAGAVTWDGKTALSTIRHETGGPDVLTASRRDAMMRFAQVMGCTNGDVQAVCRPATWKGTLTLADDGKGIALGGPIAITSGTAEAIIMAWLEGMPLENVGWGRVDATTFRALSQLHSLLFDIHARPSYVGAHVAAVLGNRIATLIDDPAAPRLNVFVGSDNNIVALASVLGVHFDMPGYGKDDPPVGGALVITVWRSADKLHRYVRVAYQAQTPDQLRELRALSVAQPPARQSLVPKACLTTPARCDVGTVLEVLHRLPRP